MDNPQYVVVWLKEGTKYCFTHSVNAGITVSSHCSASSYDVIVGINAITSDLGVFKTSQYIYLVQTKLTIYYHCQGNMGKLVKQLTKQENQGVCVCMV